MKERPILFSGAMVRALLDGSKTQTRRVVKPQPPAATEAVQTFHHPDPRLHFWANDGASLLDWTQPCPYGDIGDRLYVRETFRPVYPQDPLYNGGEPIEYDYQATYKPGDRLCDPTRWKPSIHMPRAASRITLGVTGVRVERLQSISDEDARAEGTPCYVCDRAVESHGDANCHCFHRQASASDFRMLWNGLNAVRGYGWSANPWVWVVEFKRIEA